MPFSAIFTDANNAFVQQKPEHDINQIAELLKEEKYLDEEIGKLNSEEKGNEFRRHLRYIQRFCSIGKRFISTHDIDGIFARFTGKRYPMLMYQHFFHFSPKTLKAMLENCGFEVVGCKHFCKSWSVKYLYLLLYKLWPQSKLIKMILAITGRIVNMRAIKSTRITIPIPNFFIMTAQRPR
jgi:hypothetical protein